LLHEGQQTKDDSKPNRIPAICVQLCLLLRPILQINALQYVLSMAPKTSIAY
jgi:hypothetical protein